MPRLILKQILLKNKVVTKWIGVEKQCWCDQQFKQKDTMKSTGVAKQCNLPTSFWIGTFMSLKVITTAWSLTREQNYYFNQLLQSFYEKNYLNFASFINIK